MIKNYNNNNDDIHDMINKRKLYSIENTKLKLISNNNDDNKLSLIFCGLLPPNINLYLLP